MKKLLVLGMLLVGTISQAQEFLTNPLKETVKFTYGHIGMGGGNYVKTKDYELTGYSKFDFDISSGLLYFKMSSGNYGASDKIEHNERLNHFTKSKFNELESYHFGLNIPLTKYVTITPMIGWVKVVDVWEGQMLQTKNKAFTLTDKGFKITVYPLVLKDDKYSIGVHYIETEHEKPSFGATFRVKWSALSS